MKTVVVGTGYVGLVTGTCFDETFNDVPVYISIIARMTCCLAYR